MAGAGDEIVARALDVLRAGGVVVCATETLVGLLADARSETAVARVVAIKRRALDAPIGLLVPDVEVGRALVELGAIGEALAAKHWPGPLTLVGRARVTFPTGVGRDGTVGVRVAGSSPAAEVARAFRGPLTATSANRSGGGALARIGDVRAALGDEPDLYVPGDAPGGSPSTVVDVTGAALRVVRAGAIRLA